MSEEKLVPKLRFSGFDDEWKSYKIGDISKTYSGGTPSTSKREYYEGDIPFIKSGEINNDVTEQYITEEAINNSSAKRVQKGDLLLALYGATSGEVAISKIDGAINQAVLKIDNSMDNYFQYNYFLKYKEQITHKYLQGGQGNLSANIIKKLEFNFPELNEQQKISEFLLLIDKKIQLLERKHDEYQDFKKFLMQQIFTQKLRFNDNNNEPYENWEELQLKDIISLQGGYAFKSELFKDEGVPIIRISNISPNNSVILDDLVYYDKLDNDSDFIIKKGELIIAMSGATTGKVGVYDLDQIAYINQRVGLFKQISNELYYPFLIQYTLSDTFKRELQKTLVAGAQPNISKKEIESFKINLPQYGEQKKIADLLSNIDLKINTVKNQSTEISQFKKGLLQQMFV